MQAANRNARKLKTPQACRYCGLVSDLHKYERQVCFGFNKYERRDANACGDRIRANKAAAGIPEDKSDLPF